MEIHEVEMRAERELEAGESSRAERQFEVGESSRAERGEHGDPSASVTSARASLQMEPTQDPATTDARNAPDKLWKVLFLAHLVIFLVVVIFFAVRAPNPKFYLIRWYFPLFSTCLCSYFVACAWLVTSLSYPRFTLRASLCLGPLLTLAVGIYFLTMGTDHLSALGLAASFAGFFLTIYASWAWRRFRHASQILTISLEIFQPLAGILKPILAPQGAALIYCSGWTHCVGAVATFRPRYSAAYISMLLLSLAWTMQVIRNTVHVAIAFIAYTKFVRGRVYNYTEPAEVFYEAPTRSMGSICLGSALVPVITVLRGVVRFLQFFGCHDGVCPFPCTGFCKGVADWLMAMGNRWAFVLVAAENMGIMDASRNTWQMFKRLDMEPVIDSDLTSSFCFLCGMTGGGISALVGAILVVHRNNQVEIASYAFIVGYYMSRIAMALPQACVSTYHVAYAENQQEENPQGGNPQVNQFMSILRNRIRELQPSSEQ